MLLDLDQLVATLDIQYSPINSNSPVSPLPNNDSDYWDLWLKASNKDTKPSPESKEDDIVWAGSDFPSDSFEKKSDSGKDTLSVSSLQFGDVSSDVDVPIVKSNDSKTGKIEMGKNCVSGEEFSDWSVNMVPLRETHISSSLPVGNADNNVVQNVETNLDLGWLKPTIVTPDLPRKESKSGHPVGVDVEEVFADFQAVLPEKGKPERVGPVEDDDFSDFQSSNVNSQPAPSVVQPLQPMAEVLKPNVVEEVNATSILQPTLASTQINWPDPGITDDDIHYIELNYKPKTSNSTNSDGKAQVETVKETRAVSSSRNDEDDWSDFVSSNAKTSPVNAARPSSVFQKNERTATPELQLSIPHLNQIQPPRKPIPLITPQGLMQTKITTNATLVQTSVQQNKSYLPTNPQNGYQPSLISNQYARQTALNAKPSSSIPHPYQQNAPKPQTPKQNQIKFESPAPQFSAPISYIQQMPSMQKAPLVPVAAAPSFAKDDQDDEWSDFVSSQPTPAANGWSSSHTISHNLDWNKPPQFTSWSTNFTPNIITNPVSFDSFQSYASPVSSDAMRNATFNKKNANSMVQPSKSSVSSISSIPDLDFIAPKNKSWKK